MKKWFKELPNSYQTAAISSIVVVIVYLGLIFGYFINRADIPNGFIAGGFVGVLSYVLTALAEHLDSKKQKPVFGIIVIIIRFITIAALIVVSTMLQYKTEYHVLNPFTLLGGYLISLVIYLIILIRERKNV